MKKKIFFVVVLIFVVGYIINYNTYECRGIDISHHNSFNWNLLPEDVKFCYIKASEGNDFTDPKVKANTEKASNKGLLVGYYHYYKTNVSGKSQFEHFKNVIEKNHYTLYPMLDIEDIGNDYSDVKHQKENIKEFLNCFYNCYGYYPIVYYSDVLDDARSTIDATENCKKWDMTMHFIPSFITGACISQYKYLKVGNTEIDCDKCYKLDDIIIKTSAAQHK